MSWLPSVSKSASGIYIPYVRQIEDATNGRIEFEMYHGTAIGTAKEAWEAVSTGLADVTYVPGPALYSGRIPLSNLSGFPMATPLHLISVGKALWDVYNEFPEVREEFKDVELMSFFSVTPYVINTAEKPVRKLEDMEGLKLRATGLGATFIKATGAVPVSMLASDITLAIERGILDGCLFNLLGLQSNSVYPYIDYITRVNVAEQYFAVFFNKHTWDSFPPDIQDVIWDTLSGHKGTEYIGRLMEEKLEDNIKLYKSEAIEIIYLSEEEAARWRELAKPMWEEKIAKLEAKGLPAQAVFDRYMELLEKYDKEYD